MTAIDNMCQEASKKLMSRINAVEDEVVKQLVDSTGLKLTGGQRC